VKGTDVYCAGSGKVKEEWLSSCKEERALTTDLMRRVTSLSNLSDALRQVVSNGGGAGVDGMNVQDLRKWFEQNHITLINQLEGNTYRVSNIKGVKIPKPSGGHRLLGIPTVIDRLVQQSIHQRLEFIFDPTFSVHSYGFRKGKGTHRCLEAASHYVREGYSYIIDIDLAKFFDEVNHDRLLWILGQRISDKVLLKLIGKCLRAGILEGGLSSQRIKGTPQGSPLSPLLSNIILDELDKELERRGLRFVRYADDLLIFTKSMKSAERVQSSVTNFIEQRMKLKVNHAKSGVRKPYELNYLGYSMSVKGELLLSKSSEKRLRNKLKEKTRRNRGMSIDQLIKELNPILRGWLNYFQYASMKKKLLKIVGWLRRRIRCFRLKQCKRAIGVSRFLIRQGLPVWRSWLLALSSKGWYHKSNTPQCHEAMNLVWFQELGLFDMYTSYCSKLMKPPST